MTLPTLPGGATGATGTTGAARTATTTGTTGTTGRTEAAELYHRLTSYDGTRHWTEPADDPRVRADFIPLRPGREPVPFKEYPPDLPVVPLPSDPAPRTGVLDLDAVSAVLFCAAGVVRSRPGRRGRTVHFRAASSAGNRHPIEVYLCARGIAGLPDAVWHYDPRRHALTRIGPAPEGEASALVLGGVPWRTCWKYAERGYRHLWWDCGTLVAQALAAGREHGLDITVRTAFADSELSRLVGTRTPDEVPLAVLPLTDGAAAVRPGGEAQAGDLGPGFERFPLVEAVHTAGDLADEAEADRWRAGRRASAESEPDADAILVRTLTSEPSDRQNSLESLVRRRSSTRHFDANAALSIETVRHLARMATAPYGGDSGIEPDLRLTLHTVDGFEPGTYRWARGRMVRVGPADRAVSQALCLDQQSAHDCALLAVFVTDDRRPTAREYRAAQLAAGIGLGRLYLAATALGVGCTGLTFVDAWLPDFGLTAAALGPARRAD
jgi:hypothetical protein